jgi:all-trans-retinol dehydrogenase (NAD+)
MAYWKEKTVLITGGASGIGKIMCRMLLEQGARVVIWDLNQAGIDQTLADFAHLGPISARALDVSDATAVEMAASAVSETLGTPDVLILSAGIVVGRYFHEHSTDDIRRTLDVNTVALMLVTRAFLPGMMARNSGHICTISSSASLVSNPRMSVYAASKWAATGWSDSLRLEMIQLGHRIGVTTVTPYYINTGMFDGVRSRIPMLHPEKASARILRGIARNRAFVSMPWSVHFVRFCQGVLPLRVFDWVMGDLLGVYDTMKHFTGRQSGGSTHA